MQPVNRNCLDTILPIIITISMFLSVSTNYLSLCNIKQLYTVSSIGKTAVKQKKHRESTNL